MRRRWRPAWLVLALVLLASCGSGRRPVAVRTRARAAAAVYGDLNGNGQLDAADATKVLRIVVGLDATPANLSGVDFNGNGQVDAADATKVLRVVVALDPALVMPSLYLTTPTRGTSHDATHGAVRGSVQKRLKRQQTVGIDLDPPTVWITSGSHNFYQSTDATGSYGFGNLAPAAALPINAAAPSYHPASQTVPITANQVTDAPDMALQPNPGDTTGRIRGVVYDTKGQPLAGAVVSIQSSNYVYSTEADGYYVFEQLVPGTYQVSCAAGTDSPPGQAVPVTAGLSTVADFHRGNQSAIPRVSATVNQETATVGATFNFDGTAVPGQTGGLIASYAWDFGDGSGSAPKASNAKGSHAYTQAGTFRATLKVTDALGNVGTAWQQLVVLSLPGLQVTLQPAGAVAAGATWSVDGGAAKASGELVAFPTAGSHVVHFVATSGYAAPADQVVAVAIGETLQVTGTYAAQSSSLTVTLTPATAVNAGARWHLDGDAGHASGQIITGVTAGQHALTFTAVTGYGAPLDQQITVSVPQAAMATAQYVATGTTPVVLVGSWRMVATGTSPSQLSTVLPWQSYVEVFHADGTATSTFGSGTTYTYTFSTPWRAGAVNQWQATEVMTQSTYPSISAGTTYDRTYVLRDADTLDEMPPAGGPMYRYTRQQSGLATSAWPKFHSDLRNSGLGTGRGSSGQLAWSFPTGRGLWATPSLGSDGMVYVGSGQTYALRPNGTGTPTVAWSFGSDGGSPTLAADGTVYVGSGDKKLYALKSNGSAAPTVVWSFATGSSVYSSPAVGPDGTVYVGSWDGKVYALQPNGTSTPTVIWRYATGGAVNSSPAVGTDGTVYVGSRDRKFYALKGNGSATPTVVWSFTAGDAVEGSAALGADGTVYVGSRDAKLYALQGNGSATPTVVWSFRADNWVDSTPAVGTDGTVYFGSVDGKVYAVRDNGSPTPTVVWSFSTGGAVYSSPAIDGDGMVYIGSADKKLYALKGNGSPIPTVAWSYTTGGNVGSSASVGTDGSIYIGSDDGTLYAFAGPTTSRSRRSSTNYLLDRLLTLVR